MKQKIELTNKQENVIVGAAAAALITVLLALVGWEQLSYWFTTPFVWKNTDKISVYVYEKEDDGDRFTLRALVRNNTDEVFSDYKLDFCVGGSGFTSSQRRLYGDKELEFTFRKEKDKRLYRAAEGMNLSELERCFHIREIYNTDGEKVFKQGGTVKIIVFLAVSAFAGLLAASGEVRPQWLRMLLKLVCVPSLVLVFALFLIFAFAGSSKNASTSSASDDSARREAGKRYKEAASHKAGAAMHGRTADAARAQGQMDRAFADMIAANNSQAKKEYQRWAQHKANAEMHGNKRDAAFVQQQMDRYMADMLQGK